jgi:hypothetical protein
VDEAKIELAHSFPGGGQEISVTTVRRTCPHLDYITPQGVLFIAIF